MHYAITFFRSAIVKSEKRTRGNMLVIICAGMFLICSVSLLIYSFARPTLLNLAGLIFAVFMLIAVLSTGYVWSFYACSELIMSARMLKDLTRQGRNEDVVSAMEYYVQHSKEGNVSKNVREFRDAISPFWRKLQEENGASGRTWENGVIH